MGRPVTIETQGQSHEAVFTLTFADVGDGELLLYLDSSRSLALAVNRGSAAAELRLAPGDEVVLRPL
jgi:S-adenosylmethionine hydrolase